jgi:hypothetical protein
MDFNLKDYLKKFDQFLPREMVVKNLVIQAVQEVVGITLTRAQMTVQGARVFINGPSALKSEIALKQVKILARMGEVNPDVKIERVQ